jgi:hypothetical protein
MLTFGMMTCAVACTFSLAEVKSRVPGSDASVDATAADDAADAGSAHWCEAHKGAQFCKDFDDDFEIGGWSTLSVDSGTQTLSVTSDTFVSPPHALRCGVTGIPDAGYESALGGYTSGTDADEAHLAFDIRPEIPPGHQPALLYIGARRASDGHASSLVVRVQSVGGTATITAMNDENDGSGSQQWSDSPPVGDWTRIFVDLILAPTPRVKIGLGQKGSDVQGKAVADLPLSSAWERGRPGFTLGIGFTSTVGDFVLIDNVVFSAN